MIYKCEVLLHIFCSLPFPVNKHFSPGCVWFTYYQETSLFFVYSHVGQHSAGHIVHIQYTCVIMIVCITIYYCLYYDIRLSHSSEYIVCMLGWGEKVRWITGLAGDTALFWLGGRHLYLLNSWGQLPWTDTALDFQEVGLWPAVGDELGEGRVGTESQIIWQRWRCMGWFLGVQEDGMRCRGCPRCCVNQMGRGWVWGVRWGRGAIWAGAWLHLATGHFEGFLEQ